MEAQRTEQVQPTGEIVRETWKIAQDEVGGQGTGTWQGVVLGLKTVAPTPSSLTVCELA